MKNDYVSRRNFSRASEPSDFSGDGQDAECQFQPGVRFAAHYYKLAADQNHILAQSYYASCLANGRGVSTDFSLAAHYYRLSADHNHPRAQYNYGFCVENGLGVPIHLSVAAHYYQLAADQNDVFAQYILDVRSRTHRAVSCDLDLSRGWLTFPASLEVIGKYALFCATRCVISGSVSDRSCSAYTVVHLHMSLWKVSSFQRLRRQSIPLLSPRCLAFGTI
jgi:hypothetical protein